MEIIRKALILIFILVLAMPANLASAASFPSPIQSMNEILEDLEVDKDELKKTINNTVDSSNYKNNPSAATLTFVPANPIPGKEVTAMAVPAYLVGDGEKMYYTWYLKREEKIDWNRNGRTNDIEDYKIEAMRILAKGDWKPNYLSKGVAEGDDDAYYDAIATNDNDGYMASFGGEDQQEKPEHCYVKNIATGIDYEIPRCRHVFPDTDGHGTVGDGSFGKEEEKFWGTDPESKDTNNDGTLDEEALAGKGMMEFKWIYQEGDKIGVAIEGVSEATNYADSSFKTMWAFLKNDFNAGGGCRIVEDRPDRLGFVTSDFNINDCLEDNMIDPAQGTADKKIEVALSYSPQYPINDPRGQNVDSENNSDELKIIANLSNIEDKSFVKYDWKFWLCDEGGEDCVSDIVPTANNPDPSLSPQALRDNLALSRTSGLGLDTVQATLMIDPVSTAHPTYSRFDGKTELKVVLDVIETTEQAGGKSGKGTALIPLQETQDKIEVFFTSTRTVPDPGEGELTYALETTTSREDSCQEKVCSVVKNEIIGLVFNGTNDPDNIYSWSLDGKPLQTSEERAFLPILKDSGSTYSVRLDITKQAPENELTQDKIVLTRDFNVEEPRVEIDSPNCYIDGTFCRPKEIGIFIDPYYPDDETRRTIDYSQEIYIANIGNEIILRPNFPNFDPSILEERDAQGNVTGHNFTWFIDGLEADPGIIDPDGNLRLQIDKAAGEKYSISIKDVFYTQPVPIKKALYDIWSVPKNSFYEKNVYDDLEIEVVESVSGAAGPSKKKIVASLFSLMPDYLNFLFRAFLTLILILFIANMSLVIFPKQRF